LAVARRREGGLTLTELLVAMGLSSLVAVALLTMAQVHTTLQGREQSAQRALDNVRAAVEEIASSLHDAGGPFLAQAATNAVPPFAPPLLAPVRVTNGVDGPDTLEVLGADRVAGATLVEEAAPLATALTIDAGGDLRAGALVLLSDFHDAVLYRLKADPMAVTTNGAPAARLQVDAPAMPAPTAFFPGAMLFRARPLVYSLDSTLLGGRPALVLRDGPPIDYTATPQLVAEDIEDLQVAVGVDGLRGGVASGTLEEVGDAANDDEWVYNVAGESLPAVLPPGSRVAAVRVTIVGRTATSGDVGGGRPAVEDRPAGPRDGYRWRLLTTTVYLDSVAMN
jgi:type II secretory pathway pseudopilin PulG